MFKKVFNVLLFLVGALALNAQDSIAPNFKVTDIYGQSYNLYADYGGEKYVFLDFFTNSCTFCQYYAPKIDTVYRFFGCGCGQIDFFAMNLSEYSTDQDVLNFITNFGITFNPISAEGGSAYTGDLYNVAYTPYFILIDPDTLIAMENFYFNTSQWLIDTLVAFGLQPAECQGTNLKYFEVRDSNNSTVSIGQINQELALINVLIPDTTINGQLSAFVITSSNAKLINEQGDTLSNSFQLNNLADTLKLKVIAQTDTLSKNWSVVFDTLVTSASKTPTMILYPNPATSEIFVPFELSESYAYIYNMQGRVVALKKIKKGKINISALPKGIYVLYINKNNKVFSGKLIKK